MKLIVATILISVLALNVGFLILELQISFFYSAKGGKT